MALPEVHAPETKSPRLLEHIERPKSRVVCVFCGSSSGSSPIHLGAARSLARLLHENGIRLVYGGGDVGVMGEIARSLVTLSGPDAVHGIIPRPFLGPRGGKTERHGHACYDEMIFGRTTIVPDMHTRKQMMASEVSRGAPGSGFVVLSGGFGTLEEAMENVTWNQIGVHDLPVIFYNVGGFWDGLLQWVKTAVRSGFVSAKNSKILVEATTADEVLHHLDIYRPSEERFQFQWDALPSS